MPRTKAIHNVETGETVYEPYSAEEEAEADAMAAAALEVEAAAAAVEEQKQTDHKLIAKKAKEDPVFAALARQLGIES